MTTHQAVLDILPDHVDGLRDFKIADAITCRIRGLAAGSVAVQVRTLAGASVDACNDIDHPAAVAIEARQLNNVDRRDFSVDCPAHSITVLNLE